MDIHTLIDKLEDLASQGRSVPLTRNVIVDEDRLLDIIDQMRVSIPDEINRGKQIHDKADIRKKKKILSNFLFII